MPVLEAVNEAEVVEFSRGGGGGGAAEFEICWQKI